MLHRSLYLFMILIFSITFSSAQLAPITPNTIENITVTQMLGTGRPLRGAFSPDGKLMALVGSFGVQVYELSAPDIPDTLDDGAYPGLNLAFSADSRYLAVAGGYSLRIYDLEGGSEARVIYPEDTLGPLSALAFHPDGTKLAVGTYSDMGRIVILDTATLQTHKILDTFEGPATVLSYDSQGVILAAGSDDGSISVFDGNTYTLSTEMLRHTAPVTDLAFMSGLLITSGLDGLLNVYSLPDATFVRQVSLSVDEVLPIYSIAPHPDGSLYVGYKDAAGEGVIAIVDAPSGHSTVLNDTAHRLPVVGLDISPDNSRLLSVSADFANLTDVQSLNGIGFPFMDTVYSVAVTRDGGGIVIAGSLALGSFYGVGGALYANFATDEAPVRTLAYDANGGVLIAGTDAAKVYVLGGDGNRFSVIEDVPAALTAAQFSPDNTLLALGFANGALRLYNFDALTLQTEQILHGDAIEALDFSPDGTRLITASRDSQILLWEVPTLTILGGLTGHTAGVLSVDFSPDGTQVVTGGADATARVWDINAMSELFGLTDHYNTVTSVQYSPDGSLILTTCEDGTSRLFRATNGEALETFYDHNEPVYDGAWIPDGTGFVTAGASGFAILYEVIP